MTITKNSIDLVTLTDWEQHAGPKRAMQWADGRSAKEAARAWLEGQGRDLPKEVATALAAHDAFGPVLSWQAEPEAKLPFDTFQGEPRNSDLVVYAEDAHGPYLIAVEAKADEPYGDTVSKTLDAALERYLANPRSNGVARIQQLVRALLGPAHKGDAKIRGLRYQLLTACAGALCEAERRGVSRAVMLVHEFITDKTTDENHARNSRDLDTFVKRLSHDAVHAIGSGEIHGPFEVPGAPLLNTRIPLYLGKVSRNLRSARA